MFKNILSTFTTKLLSMVISFSLVIIITRYLGASGKGTISLVVTSAGILYLFNDFIGGSSIVYLLPRTRNKAYLLKVMCLSYTWSIIVSVSGTFIMCSLNIVPKELQTPLLLFSLLGSIFSSSILILLSYERIIRINLISLMQLVILLVSFTVYIFIVQSYSLDSYFFSWYLSYVIGILIMFILIYREFVSTKNADERVEWIRVVKEMGGYGVQAQLGNVLQYLNYRLDFFFMIHYWGSATLGIYSVGVVIAEAIWLIPTSVALVLYSKIANIENESYSRDITIKLTRACFAITVICTAVLLLVPSNVYALIFGPEFSQVRSVVLWLSVGIISLSVSKVLSSYFAGKGKFYINTISSAVGFMVTVVGDIFLISKYGYKGACLTTCAAYLIATVIQLCVFFRWGDEKLSSLIPRISDIRLLISSLRNMRSKQPSG